MEDKSKENKLIKDIRENSNVFKKLRAAENKNDMLSNAIVKGTISFMDYFVTEGVYKEPSWTAKDYLNGINYDPAKNYLMGGSCSDCSEYCDLHYEFEEYPNMSLVVGMDICLYDNSIRVAELRLFHKSKPFIIEGPEKDSFRIRPYSDFIDWVSKPFEHKRFASVVKEVMGDIAKSMVKLDKLDKVNTFLDLKDK